MIPELGHFALILAAWVVIAQSAFGLAGPAFARERWIAAVRPAVQATDASTPSAAARTPQPAAVPFGVARETDAVRPPSPPRRSRKP